MSEEFTFYNDWNKKILEGMAQAFIYSIGEYVAWNIIDDTHKRILDALFYEMASGISGHDCYCSRTSFLDWDDKELTWSQFDEKIRTELCDLIRTGFRVLIRVTLPKIEFPEEGVLDQLKEKLPVLFAD